jgi:hypothetical protein
MPKLTGNKVPSYRLHKQSGQAIVTLNGRDHLLGRHGTPESQSEYNRLIAEWIAGGRQLPKAGAVLTVSELIIAFWRHAEIYYRKPDGTPTSEQDSFRDALRPLRRLYAETRAADFGPRALKALRESMIQLGWCRTHINKQIARIKRVFKWGVENGRTKGDKYIYSPRKKEISTHVQTNMYLSPFLVSRLYCGRRASNNSRKSLCTRRPLRRISGCDQL